WRAARAVQFSAPLGTVPPSTNNRRMVATLPYAVRSAPCAVEDAEERAEKGSLRSRARCAVRRKEWPAHCAPERSDHAHSTMATADPRGLLLRGRLPAHRGDLAGTAGIYSQSADPRSAAPRVAAAAARQPPSDRGAALRRRGARLCWPHPGSGP